MTIMRSFSQNAYKSKTLQQIIKIAQSTDYFNAQIINNNINNVEILPMGKIICQNIEKQWKHSHKTNKLENHCEPIQFQKYFSMFDPNWNHLTESSVITSKCLIENFPLSHMNDFIGDQTSKTILSCTYCCNESLSIEMFSKLQRQRKIWWMNVRSFIFCSIINCFLIIFYFYSLHQIHKEYPFLN